jgi:hypothetical protein
MNEAHASRRGFRTHRVKRAVRALMGMKKVNSTLQREKDGRYFGHVWLDRQLYEAVSFLARANGCTKKQLVHDALQAGLSGLLAQAILEANRQAASQAENGLPPRRTPLARELRRLAREKGLDVGDSL